MKALKKILHVEDDIDIQAVTRLSLETFGGFTVEQCSSGKEALLKAPGFMPDLLLLDIMMPGMDGITLLLELRKLESTSKIPVIFMTAKAQENEIKKFKSLGAIGVVTKPFDPVTLADQIKEIWSI